MEAGTTRLELPEQSVYDENVPNTRKVSHLTSRLEELSSKPHLPTNAAPIPIERWTKILRSATIALVFLRSCRISARAEASTFGRRAA